MNALYTRCVLLLTLLIVGSTTSYAQTTISGIITDAVSGEPLAGVNIVVKGKVVGTISDIDGKFSLIVHDAPPFTLLVSFVGFATQEFNISTSTANLAVEMSEQTMLGQEVVVSASRMEENILSSPVTIEKVDLLGIQQAATPEFYDALANVKGVQFTSSSLNFPQINTRGFATISNVRFVQLIDGMDTSAPLLNFPTGNLVGIGELDAESMELVPGAASALYGPNAFNGILIMKSKSPFEYQGLSAQGKWGITTSDAQGQAYPYYSFNVRYAKAFNNKFAFKVNFAYMDAEDWHANDYKTDADYPESKEDLSGNPDFNGLNLYGDEIAIPTGVPSIGTIRRTGFREEDILDDYNATSIKGDLALHYRINDDLEVLYNYRYGGGGSVYQGSQKYALRNFNQQFHKLEFRGDNFFARAYVTGTDAGDSYNMGALGTYMNEYYSSTEDTWASDYVLAMQGYIDDVDAGSHDAARAYADRNRPARGTAAFDSLAKVVRKNLFQRNPPGAKFVDHSRLYHGEFNYNFQEHISFAEVMIGGNVRQYNLFSDGTIFNEDPENGEDFKRIKINEFGAYTQISKNIADVLKLTGSVRFDKNENFNGRVTPRFSAVYTAADNHHFRASFQTGFRNPETQAQFIFFDAGTNILLGSTKANAERYGVFNGGAWTRSSYEAFVASGDSSVLKTADVRYVQPEKLRAVEIGYKGIFANKLLIDVNAYFNAYTDFIGSLDIASKEATTHQGRTLDAGTIFTPYVNSSADVTSHGIGVGLTYNLPRSFQITGNYSYATFRVDDNESEGYRAQFNTPRNKFNVSLSNRKLTKSLGFNVSYRWQETFFWESDFGSWNVPEYGVIDAQLSYRLADIKSILKIGGTNLFGGDYRTNLGGPFVGQMYYLSVTFDEFFK